MRVIIIHHLESVWSDGYAKAGTNFDEQAEELVKWLKAQEYSRVILTRCEEWTLGHEHEEHGLEEWVDDVYPYGYGWEEGQEGDGCDWIEGGTHSEVLPVFNWQKGLRGCEVDLCGGFDGECLEDMEISLQGAGVKFNRIHHLIV